MKHWFHIAFMLSVGLALMAVVVGSGVAHAMNMCGLRAAMIKTLDTKFKERAVAMALSGGVSVVEVYSTASGSTWTMIVTDAAGKTCIFAAGKNWKKLIPEIEGEPL